VEGKSKKKENRGGGSRLPAIAFYVRTGWPGTQKSAVFAGADGTDVTGGGE
jgi:hypothetical protein